MKTCMLDRLRPALPVFALGALLALSGCASRTAEPEPEPEPEPEAAAPAPTDTAEKKVDKDVVRPAHPVRYVVKRGDTLWDIAAMFLRDPWVWPEIWSVNPQIENPHLIYPGDVITLAWVGDEPRLVVDRPGIEPAPEGLTVEKLEPRVRELPLEQAIPSIPADAIRQFLNRPRVLPREELDAAPYIVGNYEGRLISAEGDDVFARGFPDGGPQSPRYNVVRPGDPLTDPDSGEILGYEAVHAGLGVVSRVGDPVRLSLIDSTREILNGDRLFPAEQDPTQARYIPQPPAEPVEGRIIALFDAISQVGSKQVVVINLGARAGMETGHVLAIRQSGGTVRDAYAEEPGEEVTLPPQDVGTLMVFKVFDRVSYGLIMDSTRAIHLHDTVTNP